MRKQYLIAAAITACLCLAAGLASFCVGQNEADQPLQAEVSAAKTAEGTAVRPQQIPGGGEPIEGEYIVRKKDGSYDLVKTDDPDKLKEDPEIAGIEQNRTVVAFGAEAAAITGTDVTDMQYGDKMVRAPQAWEMVKSAETKAVKVAVIDTGVDGTHPDLKDKVLPGKTIVQETAAGNQYADDGKDDNGHGTHVAGIIAATIENGQGINGIAGAVEAQILPVKVLNDAGRGSTYDIIEGLHYAADQGASIINLSLGSYSKSEMEEEAVRYAQNKGCLIVAAAGNDSFNVQYNYPASYDGVLSVGSVDSEGDRSYFSNFGETLDVAAPGSDIVSTVPAAIARQDMARGEIVYGNEEEGYYETMSGTSMATPHAAGVAALYKAAHPEEVGFDIADLMIETCQDVGDPGKDIETGAGIVDAAAMLGGEIIRTPLSIKKPQEGQEVYEEISLSAQINPAMGIKRLCFYLDQADEADCIAETECDGENAFYSIPWDTKNAPDGTHQLLAAVYDENGDQVGETQQVSIRILNSISNGFTLQVKDPSGTEAKAAAYYVYQKESGGEYALAGRGKTTDLGFARIKGLSQEAGDFILIISGSSDSDDGSKSRYIYRRQLQPSLLGTKILIDGDQSRRVDFQAIGEDEEPLASPYLKVLVDGGGSWMSAENAFRMQQDSRLYLDDGSYRVTLFHEVDRNGTAYCIEKDLTVTESQAQLHFAPSDGVRIQAKFPADCAGEMMLEGADKENEIPFLSGVMYGTRFYLTQGRSYTAQATLKAEDESGSIWSVQLKKKDPVRADGRKDVVFAPQIGVSDLSSGQTDLYIGERLTAQAAFGDAGGDELINMMGHFPVLRIYREEDGQRTLVYEKESRWNADAPSWNSAQDYSGSVPPVAGSYVAELSFDAGPFGGATAKEIPFRLKTRSGKNEMSSTLRVKDGDTIYQAVGADLSLYTWDGQEKAWKAATSQKIPAADSQTGVITGILTDDIELDESGIHAALISLKERKDGYQAAERYTGFAVVPFAGLSDLSEITVEADQLRTVKVQAQDPAGNPREASIYLPVRSDGGRLSEARPLGEYSCRISRESSGTKLHIPAGSYEYMNGVFSDSKASYILRNAGFIAGEDESILLGCDDTAELTLAMPEHFSLRLSLAADGLDHGLAISPATDRLRITKGTYDISAVLTDPAEEYRYRVAPAQRLDLTQDQVWTVSGDWKAEVLTDRKFVKPGSDLSGRIAVTDGEGNRLSQLQKLDQESGNYAAVSPALVLAKDGAEISPLDLSGDGEFLVPASLCSEEGTYTLKYTGQLPGSGSVTGESSFRVQAEHEKPLWKTAAKLTYEWTGTGEITFSWNADDVKLYDGCRIAGYRIYYSENELHRWKDLTGDELITETTARIGMSPETDGYYYKVEAVDETGAESENGPFTEVLGQYPWLTIKSGDGQTQIDLYEEDLAGLPKQQLRYSARNNYGTDDWYAAEGICLDDLAAAAGFTEIDRISVRGKGLDPLTFTAADIAGEGYYYYPKNYDDDQVKAVQVKPMLALSYSESEDYEPGFGPGGEGTPRLFFGQQSVGDVNRPFFVKEIYEVVVYGSREDPDPELPDIDPVTPADETADKAPVDPGFLSGVSISGASASLKAKSITVSFPAVKNAVNYRIYYRKAGAEDWSSAWTGGRTRYTLTGLKTGGLYEVKAAAFAKKDESWVRSADSRAVCRYLAGVTKVKAKAGKKRFTVTWKPAAGSSGSRIMYSTARSMKGAKVKTIKGSRKKAVIKKLKKKKRYYVQITPYKVYKGKTYLGVPSGRKAVKTK